MFARANHRGSGKKGTARLLTGALAACFVILQVFSAFVTTNVYGATVNEGTVKARSGFVRKSSSTAGEVSFCVSSGEKLAILSEEKGSDGKTWYKVAQGNATGYIRSDLVTKTDKKIAVSDSLVTTDKKSQASSNAKPAQNDDTKTKQSTQNTQTSQTVSSTTTASAQTGVVKGTSVRLRSNASTSSNIVSYLNIGDVVTILGEGKASDGQNWYQVRKGESTGFIRSDLVNKVAGDTTAKTTATTTAGTDSASTVSSAAAGNGDTVFKTGKGNVKGTSVRVRESATTTADNVVSTVNNGQEMTILAEEAGADRKWYKIEAKIGDKTVTGYVAADYITVTEEVKMGQTAATTTVTDTSQNNTQDAAAESREEQLKAATQEALKNISNQVVKEGTSAAIKGVGVRIRQLPVDGNVVCQLSSGHPLTISNQTEGSDGNTWYQVSFSYLGSMREGYVRSDLVTISSSSEMANAPIGSEEFEASIAALPESYKNSLRSLHAAHPYWTFEAVDTGLDWNAALTAESSVGKNLVSKNSIASWKSTAAQAYNWSNNTWYTFDGGSWASASSELIAYYMDPRNFLNDSGIYMFESLDYSPTQSTANVSKMLTGTFMSGDFTDTDGQVINYAEGFRTVGELTGVSPYLLAGRCLQEQGVNGTSQSISGNVPGYAGYFNYFNIGAYAYSGRTATINGLIYATGTEEEYMRPWNTRARSIFGGAKYLAEKYVSKGQNTLYFQKFNVVNSENTLYSHQYMTNIQAASSESARLALAYLGDDEALHFRIPFYRNMPDTVCVKPTSDSNPNTYLASLSIDGYNLIPEFSGVTENYTITVDPNLESVNINATAVSPSSAVGGTGTYKINPGTNTLYVGCKAQNGSIKVYTITVNR